MRGKDSRAVGHPRCRISPLGLPILALVLGCAAAPSHDRAVAEPPSSSAPEPETYPLESCSTAELLSYLRQDEQVEPPFPITDEDRFMASMADELLERKELKAVVAKMETVWEFDPVFGYLWDVLSRMEGPELESELRRLAASEPSQLSFLSLMHFAGRGEEWALEVLNDNWHSYGPSYQWGDEAVPLFGKFKYEPAVPNLIEWLSAASLNIVFAALTSLKQIYPDADCPETLNEAIEFWWEFRIPAEEGEIPGARARSP